jgi:hypothetical protein
MVCLSLIILVIFLVCVIYSSLIMRGLVAYLGSLLLLFLYIVMCWKIAEVKPTLARYLQTPLLAAGYGFVGTIIAAIFIGAHAALYLFVPISLLSLRKAWIDARPDDPAKETGNFWTG